MQTKHISVFKKLQRYVSVTTSVSGTIKWLQKRSRMQLFSHFFHVIVILCIAAPLASYGFRPLDEYAAHRGKATVCLLLIYLADTNQPAFHLSLQMELYIK